jgi:hypothetical protein
MQARPILRQLQFGSTVAEQEPLLTNYFIETSSFWEVVDDRADIITGAKGAGKSAMARRLIDNTPVEGLDDVDVIPAFNLQGSVIFRRLASQLGSVDEGSMRTLWTVYILSLIGNHVVSEYGQNGLAGDIYSTLKDSGLLLPDSNPKSLWSLVLGALGRSRISKLEASLTVTEIGLPLAGVAMDLAERAVHNEPVDWEALLEAIVEFYQFKERRCWVVFDRLDEAFADDPILERVALRALLRTHMDLVSYGATVRTKLFLRTDLLDRITEDQGFVNATHLRMQRLKWDHGTMVDMVARRILESDAIRDVYGFSQDTAKNPKGRWKVCLAVIPQDLGGNNTDVFAWIGSHTSDASDELNPRNVLTLLTEARSTQLQIFDRDDPELDLGKSLLSGQAMFRAVKTLSRARLTDTLYAEFPHLRPHIEKLRGRASKYSEGQFASVFGMRVDSNELNELIANFKYAGFIRQSPNKNLTIPVLYRSALSLDNQNLRWRPPQPTPRRKSS